MKRTVYCGCGHAWVIFHLHWDYYDETVEGWCYWP